MSKSTRTITIVYNTAFYVYKFRVNLINDLRACGFRVVVISPVDEYVETLEALGLEHHPINMSQYGMNPFKELHTTWEIYRAFKRYSPVCSLHYTIKPNIFAGLAARIAKVSVINNVAGAGRAFSDNQSCFSRFIGYLYRLGLSRSRKVFFQNNDDMAQFLEAGVVRPEVAERLPGSGVDLSKYHVTESESSECSFRFLFVGRLLKEKGIQEYLSAADKVIRTYTSANVFFDIVGEHDSSGACIPKDELESYLQGSRFHYHGTVSPDQMPVVIGRSDCVVLPSYYREGVPRSLLEASAMGKPIITTDNIGCREVVEDGFTGYMVPVRDTTALSAAMIKVLELSADERRRMGDRGRKKIEAEFDENVVLEAYRRAVYDIVEG